MFIYRWDVIQPVTSASERFGAWIWIDLVEEPAAWLGVILLIAITYLQFRQNQEFHHWEVQAREQELERLEREAEEHRPKAIVGIDLNNKVVSRITIEVPKVIRGESDKEEIGQLIQSEKRRVIDKLAGMQNYDVNRFMRDDVMSNKVEIYLQKYQSYMYHKYNHRYNWCFTLRFGVKNIGKVAIHSVDATVRLPGARLQVLDARKESELHAEWKRPQEPVRPNKSPFDYGIGYSYPAFLPPDLYVFSPFTVVNGEVAEESFKEMLAGEDQFSDLIYVVCKPNDSGTIEVTYTVHAAEMDEKRDGKCLIKIEEIEDYNIPMHFGED